MNDEELEKLMGIIRSLTEDVMGLRKREILTHSTFMVLKELAIDSLATDRSLNREEAKRVFQDSVEAKYESKILQIGDYDPEFAQVIDLHKQREDEWLAD